MHIKLILIIFENFQIIILLGLMLSYLQFFKIVEFFYNIYSDKGTNLQRYS